MECSKRTDVSASPGVYVAEMQLFLFADINVFPLVNVLTFP